MKIDYSQVSIAIPTNGRPGSLKNCIRSVINNISKLCPIYILDSTPGDTDSKVLQDYSNLYDEFPSIRLLRYEYNIPPGKARNILAHTINTEYCLFLDDDIEVCPQAFKKIFDALVTHNYDIISGLLKEDDFNRPLGFLYTEAVHNEQKILLKCEIPSESIPENSVVTFHDVPCPLLVRMSIFSEVNFDNRYDWFYELYDFFYQCRLKNLKVGAHSGASFLHKPKPYLSKSSRFYQKRQTDYEKFISKWKIQPEFIRYPKNT